jgi:flagellar biosynthesis activator protein FlaF
MLRNPLKAYQTVNQTTMPGREAEAAVLTKAALKLTECQKCWDSENRDTMLKEALKFTQLVWSIFQGELAKKDNPLPTKLKIDIIRLSGFIDTRIFQIMGQSKPDPKKLDIIIKINQNIAAGLRGAPFGEI